MRGEVNLGTFYFAGVVQNYDWTDPGNDNLWRDGIKTLFDPCPTGWRVPKSGGGILSPWSTFGTNAYAAPFYYYINGVKQTAAGTPAFVSSPNNGRRYEADGTKAWYPAPGLHGPSTGVLAGVGNQGFGWSSTVSGAGARYLDFHSTLVSPSGAGSRAYGFPVRCVRE